MMEASRWNPLLGLLLLLLGCEGRISAEGPTGMTCEEISGAPSTSLLVEHDLRFASVEDARIYLGLAESTPDVAEEALIVSIDGPAFAIMPLSVRDDITYCVSDTLGEHRNAVIRALAYATAIWSSVVDVHFRLVHPPRCEVRGEDARVIVVSDCVFSPAIADAMLPWRGGRNGQTITLNVCHDIWPSAVLSPDAMERIFLHELGHILGFVHAWNTVDYEGVCQCQTRTAFLTLSPYDPASIMNYPECGATWTFFEPAVLSEQDRLGARKVYCAPGKGPPPCWDE